ncbi:MAG: response regulator transcription factor [Pseudomonadales bacterium]|nr:response regulator transcription factor [Pseudomonadales bacterium]
MAKILVVDDDPHIRDVMVFALEKQGYQTLQAENGLQAVDKYFQHKPDLLVMDIMMPEMSGLEACKAIRKQAETPIIFVTAMDDEIDMILGLELGGDDYIFKPFSPRQLVARVRAVLRRTLQPATENTNSEDDFRKNKLFIDRHRFQAAWDDHPIVLTVTEINLLLTLTSFPGKVFSRSELMQRAYDNVIVSDRTIDSHIRRVRSKFAALDGYPIETVHGAGYKLSLCE